MDALSEAIKLTGGKAALARALNTTPQVVNNWALRGRVPPLWAKPIEAATAGRVTAEQLCPDVFCGPQQAA